MNTYKVSFQVTKMGLFSDTKVNGIEYDEAETEKDAYIQANSRASKLSRGGILVTINNVELAK